MVSWLKESLPDVSFRSTWGIKILVHKVFVEVQYHVLDAILVYPIFFKWTEIANSNNLKMDQNCNWARYLNWSRSGPDHALNSNFGSLSNCSKLQFWSTKYPFSNKIQNLILNSFKHFSGPKSWLLELNFWIKDFRCRASEKTSGDFRVAIKSRSNYHDAFLPVPIECEFLLKDLFLNDLNVVLIHFEPLFGVKSLKSNKKGWCEMVFINTR